MTKTEYLIKEIIACCEDVQNSDQSERMKELAEIVAYEHIRRIMKGVEDD